MKIGIPRGLFYYCNIDIIVEFFKNLKVELVISKDTDESIINSGQSVLSNVCLALQIFLGHCLYLQDKCDYLIILDYKGYNKDNHYCFNYKYLSNILKNKVDTPILNYKIAKKEKIKDALKYIALKLKFTNKEIKKAYKEAVKTKIKNYKVNNLNNKLKLKIDKKKVLVIGYDYILKDSYLSKDVLNFLESKYSVIYSSYFNKTLTKLYSLQLLNDLDCKFTKEKIGSIPICYKVDYIIFLTLSDCHIDNIVINLLNSKINVPYIELEMNLGGPQILNKLNNFCTTYD